MSDLPKDAVELLYPTLTIIMLVAAFVIALIGTAWGGFRWLRGQVREVASELLAPIVERAMRADAKAMKAHRRISRLRLDVGLPPDHYDEFDTRP